MEVKLNNEVATWKVHYEFLHEVTSVGFPRKYQNTKLLLWNPHKTLTGKEDHKTPSEKRPEKCVGKNVCTSDFSAS